MTFCGVARINSNNNRFPHNSWCQIHQPTVWINSPNFNAIIHDLLWSILLTIYITLIVWDFIIWTTALVKSAVPFIPLWTAFSFLSLCYRAFSSSLGSIFAFDFVAGSNHIFSDFSPSWWLGHLFELSIPIIWNILRNAKGWQDSHRWNKDKRWSVWSTLP